LTPRPFQKIWEYFVCQAFFLFSVTGNINISTFCDMRPFILADGHKHFEETSAFTFREDEWSHRGGKNYVIQGSKHWDCACVDRRGGGDRTRLVQRIRNEEYKLHTHISRYTYSFFRPNIHTYSHTHTCTCGKSAQTVDHILYNCEILNKERDSLISIVENTNKWPTDQRQLIREYYQ
jgi:hypothetical protein